MKCGILIFLVVCTAASVAEDFLKSRPLATLIPEYQFTQERATEMAYTIEHKRKTTKKKTTTTTTIKTTTVTTPEPTTPTPKPDITTLMPDTTTPKPTTTTPNPKTKPKPKTTTPKPTTTTPKPTTTTPKPTTTTPKPTTTTPKPTTTTPKPTTTTPKPTTTTPKPTTTTPKPTTTTPKPTTTTGQTTTATANSTTTTSGQPTTSGQNTTATANPTTAKPTAPPKPTPPADLLVGNYTVKKNGTVCVLAHMALQIRLESAKANGTFNVLPRNATSNGTCLENVAFMNISFPEGFITFTFNKNSTGNMAYVEELSFSLYYPFSTPAEKYSQKNSSQNLFAAKVGHCHSCRTETVYMGNGLHLDLTQTRMQAFNFSANNEFGTSDPCPADEGGFGVAIAVGIVLVVLIIVVVVAYLVGSRRRANGYQSL